MLQKMFGCSLITKLCSILLMEADFNRTNKQSYGIQMLLNAPKYILMPEEIYCKRNRMVDDRTLTKVLTYNIIRKMQRPAGIALVDANTCYNRLAHTIASMVFQVFDVPSTTVETMLTTIQEMKFFLCTGFGNSMDSASSKFEIKSQGFCQGNGASPAGWAIVSICIINAHKKKDHVAHFICPITKLKSHIAGVIYVDDMDLVHFCMDTHKGREDMFYGIQESVEKWGQTSSGIGRGSETCKMLFPSYLLQI